MTRSERPRPLPSPCHRAGTAARATLAALLALPAALLAVPREAPAATPPIDAFVCDAARRSPGGARPGPVHGVDLDDQFAAAATIVRQPSRLCAPATLDGTAPGDAATHLVRHALRVLGPHPKPHGVRVDNALGSHDLDLGRPNLLLAPTAVDPGAAPAPLDPGATALDRYLCYPARASGGPASFAETALAVTGGDGSTQTYVVRRPRQLCAPAGFAGAPKKNAAWHLACYDARPAVRGRTAVERGLHVDSSFGATTLDTRNAKEICLPSRAVHACNGAPELCDRRFDEVSYATTHNAMSNVEDGFTGPNQRFAVPRQLADGVRGLMLDTHYDAGVATLCHAFCSIGKHSLVETLSDIREFLEQNPYEIASIIFESNVSAADTEAAFAAAGLLPFTHAQPVAAPWPTLREMIATDRRLVVFTDSGGGTYPWYHHVWSYAFETHFSFSTPASLSCTPNRGSPSNPLFILNHFLTNVFGSPELAAQINFDPLFIDRARACMAANSALPNFVTVDFHDIGDVLRVVDALNGL